MEIAGINIGAPGLPGLFAVCIDCFDLIHRGLYLDSDYALLATRLGNQRLRFKCWGEACGMSQSLSYDSRLDEPELRGQVIRSMEGIVHLFVDGSKLLERYQSELEEWQIVLSTRGPGAEIFREIAYDFLHRISQTQTPLGALSAARWAIEDKGKLRELVNHLDRILGDLEELTASLGVTELQRCYVEYEVESIADITTLSHMIEARSGAIDIVSDAASLQLEMLLDIAGQSGEDVKGATLVDRSLSTNDPPYTVPTCPEHEANPEQIVCSHSENRMELPLRVITKQDQPEPMELEPPSPQNMGLMAGIFSHAMEPEGNVYFDEFAFGKALSRVREADDERLKMSVNYGGPMGIMKRVRREIESFSNSHEDWTSLAFDGNIHDRLVAHIEGPPATPYEGGVFQISIKIPADYPLKPPECRFLTEIYHPNISQEGEIFINILGDEWSPVMTLEALLISIISILTDPITEDAACPEIAAMYLTDQKLYEANARFYTQTFATPEIALAAQASRLHR